MKISQVLKFNPWHDRNGRFSHRQAGPAERLAAAHKPTRPISELIDSALPNPGLRQEYQEALAKAEQVFVEESTRQQYTKPGTRSYTPERLELHRKIIGHFLENAKQYEPEPGKKPTAILLGGRGGSGKSNMSKARWDQGVYDPKKFLVVDSDRIKELLPGYSPEHAPKFHGQSTDLMDKVLTAARKRGINVVLDFTMNSDKTSWVRAFQKDGYDVEGYFLHRPAELAVESGIHRWTHPTSFKDLNGTEKTFSRGRLVPPSVILGSNGGPGNFDRLIPLLSKWAIFDNSTREFKLQKVAGGQKPDFSTVLKFNPYHDGLGRFSSEDSSGSRSLTVAITPDRGTDINLLLDNGRIIDHRISSRVQAKSSSSEEQRTDVLAQIRTLKESSKGTPEENKKINELYAKLADTFRDEGSDTAWLDSFTTEFGDPKNSLNAKVDPALDKVAGDGLKFFNRLVGDAGTVSQPTIAPGESKNRSSYSSGTVTVNLHFGANKEVVVHELGHWLEDVRPDVFDAATSFLVHRYNQASGIGKEIRPINELSPIRGFSSEEVAFKDKFESPYVGKLYVSRGKFVNTEVISMGMQYLVRDPVSFKAKDPEYYHFMLGVIHSVRTTSVRDYGSKLWSKQAPSWAESH